MKTPKGHFEINWPLFQPKSWVSIGYAQCCVTQMDPSLYLLLSWTLDLNFKQLSGNWHNPIVIGSAIYFLLFEWWVSHALFLSVSFFIHEEIKSSKDFPPFRLWLKDYGCLLTECTKFKGQLITKCFFVCHRLDQNTNEIFSRISALASKNRLNQKLYYTEYVI